MSATRSKERTSYRLSYRLSYRSWGLIGYAAGLALVAALARTAAPTATTLVILALVPAASFLFGVKLSVVVFAYERIVFYEQALLATAGTALALWLGGQPVACGLGAPTSGAEVPDGVLK